MEFLGDSAFSALVKKLKPKQNLLAVSKLQPIEKIEILHAKGQKNFAENYIQEAIEKTKVLKNLDIEWHLIGPIQKNKVKLLQNHFAYIHSVDSLELAKKISEKALEIDYIQKVFIQINLAEEATKSGLQKAEFLNQWQQFKGLKGIEVVGLMTMPPLENDAEKNRIYFKELKKLGDQLNLHELSMGTSQDYEVALEEGATWIRIGTMLFGERLKK
ncbi:MAG: YggS family pyridoxal phosphate-dependent enzyme [Bdellovibrio sp.]|nr:YggS family pyridoxal phosphate-dependent enzyme [Bdellovibrio sp.]